MHFKRNVGRSEQAELNYGVFRKFIIKKTLDPLYYIFILIADRLTQPGEPRLIVKSNKHSAVRIIGGDRNNRTDLFIFGKSGFPVQFFLSQYFHINPI